MDLTNPWMFLPVGYAITVLIETPILFVGLSRRHPTRDRLIAGLWLTACTYPIVVLVLPTWLVAMHGWPWGAYLAVAETFAPLAECALFWLAYGTREEWLRPSMGRDMATVTLANLASFGIGEVLHSAEVF